MRHFPVLLLAAAAAATAAAATLRDVPLAGAAPPYYLDSPAQAWVATEAALGLTLNATVPGDIITDLQRAGVIGDPWYELTFLDNRTLWDNARAWSYSTTLALPPPGAPAGAALLLVLEGVKMGARVSLNGVPLGNVTNQFVRYTFPLPPQAVLAGGAANTLTVAFDASLPLAGRFMACTGGWDWAPLSQLALTDPDFGTAFTFSSGIWKSLYVLPVAPAAVAITSVAPLTRYLGAYPVGALVEGAHAGFSVNVTVRLWAPPGGATGALTVQGSWGGAPVTSPATALPGGQEVAVSLLLPAPASQVRLWWPNGMGQQPLYNVSVAWAPASGGGPAVLTSRRLGFRLAALVTVNDTNATVLAESTGANGSGNFGMFFRINGAALYARGANVVPMEELEGRLDALGYATLVHSAADAGMNMFRVWGGGIYPPDAFYDTCDERGVLLYHDLQFARGNLPAPLPPAAVESMLSEVAHQVRRLAPHPALILYDSNNEDVVQPSGPTAVYASLLMAAVAAEDGSRLLWPNSPSTGWRSGVDRLLGTANGQPLVAQGGGKDFLAGNEWHRFYQAGVGAGNWTTIIRDPWTQAHTFDPALPPAYFSPSASPATGVAFPSSFVSEFGSASFSSFESMSGTLAPESWGLHGGAGGGVPGAPPACTPQQGSFYNNCTGRNAMAQRNWACDNIIWSYFGPALLNCTGEACFKGALFQCQVAAALNMGSVVESHRAGNFMGTLIWQLNEVFPTGGWGSLEYGSPASPGSLRGGRWKPMHYWFKAHLFADVMSACGYVGRSRSSLACYVSNARSGAPFAGALTLTAIDLATGASSPWAAALPVAAPPGPAGLAWPALPANASLPNASTTLLVASLQEAGAGGQLGQPFDVHVVHLTAPLNLRLQRATVTAQLAPAPNADGSVDIHLSTTAVALFVTLTCAAPGRFSDNAFLLLPSAPLVVQWLPFSGTQDAAADYATLQASLRVEDLSAYAQQQL